MLRLASLLWRLRRATAIETGLLQLQSDIISELKGRLGAQEAIDQPAPNGASSWSSRLAHADYEADRNSSLKRLALTCVGRSSPDFGDETSNAPNSEIARCFLRLANLDNGAFDRANRYETALWRQLPILLTLDFLRRNRPCP